MAARVVPWIAVIAFSAWYFAQTPSHDRDWPPEQSRMARARIEGDRAHLTNVRSFRWQGPTTADERWVEREVELSRVSGLDVIVSSWGLNDLVHTTLSWTLEGDEPLAISIESRREVGEPFDPFRGFLRQYELLYVVADEADLVPLRAVHRRERVMLFRTSAARETAQRLLRVYLEELETLAREPAFYDSLSRNCTTAARRHVASVGVEDTWDWRVVLNGHLDAFLYERGLLDRRRSLEALRRESDITERARAADGDPRFSSRIREGVPTPASSPE